jgi:hypothetical protein
MVQLYIENNELDITKDIQQRITYAIDDLTNLDSKATAFSQTIVLPGTAKNNSLLGNIFELNNSNYTTDNPNVGYNFNAAKNAKAQISSNGLQLIKGVMRLMEIVRVGDAIEYEVAVFGELGGLISSIGNKRIQDLDFNDYNHVYSIANITGSWANYNAGSGYYYPLIDYGNVSTNKKDYKYTALRTALFVREYVDKIITGAGYTWQSSFFNTDFFKRLIIPQNQRTFSTDASLFFDGERNGLDLAVSSVSGPIYTSSPVEFSTVNYLKNFTYSGGVLTNTSGQALTVRVILEIGFSYYSVNRDVFIYGFVNGTNSGTFGFLQSTGNTIYQNYLLYNELQFTIPIGGTFQVKVVHPNDGTTQFFDVYMVNKRTLSLQSVIPVVAEAQINDSIFVKDVIPKGIFQKDFLTSIMKMFYLLVTEDKFKDKHLIIEPYVNFFDGSVVDWSDKLDRNSPIKIKPMSEVNARYYQLKYKQDADFYNEEYRKKFNEGYGDRIYDNGLEFAKDTETVEVIFSASALTGTVGEDKVVPAIYKKSNAGAAEDSFDHNIRIMQAKRITGVSTWHIRNANNTGNLHNETEYGYAGHFDDPDAPNADLNFGALKELYFALVSGNLSNNLFNTYYSPYLAEVTDKDSRLIKAKFKLSDVDIYNVDFSKFIFIDGGLYRISKIMDYVPGGNELTQVELLRVINTDY